MSVRLLMISGDHDIWFLRKLYGQSKMFTCDRIDQMMILLIVPCIIALGFDLMISCCWCYSQDSFNREKRDMIYHGI
jgi:hypothetical protein